MSLTRGEAGPVAPGSLRPGETLGRARERELAAAARALGAGWNRCLGHPDGGLAGKDAVPIAREVAALLSRHEPALLLTFGEDGLYGHLDHLATREIAMLAAKRIATRPAVLEAIWRPGLVSELVDAAAARGLPCGLWNRTADAFGSPAAIALIALDVRPVVARKLRALSAHRTQFAPDHLLAALPHDLAERFLGCEEWAGSDPAAAATLRHLVR